MKAHIEAGILALQGFYAVVNTKEKAILLILLCFLINTSGLTYRFATVEAIERLMKVNCEINHYHSLEQTKASEARLILLGKTKASTKQMESMQ